MKSHKFWGKVEDDWAGFSAEIKFTSPHFNNTPFTIFLGEEFDEDGEEAENPPTEKELDDFQNAYSAFLANIETILLEIKSATFERYLKLYAHYYENEAKSGEPPLNIDSKEKHFENIKKINYLRILANGNIKIPIHYKIDREHGIEIRLENNNIIDVGGIAET